MEMTNLEDFRYYSMEIQATAKKYFNPERVKEYMEVVNTRGGADCVMGVVSYIIIIISKYVQMIASYHITNRDADGLRTTFEWFNKCFSSYQRSYKH